MLGPVRVDVQSSLSRRVADSACSVSGKSVSELWTILRCMEGDGVTKAQCTQRRVRAIRSIRRSTELEGAASTGATRADQLAYARGTISAAELGERVRRRYNVS